MKVICDTNIWYLIGDNKIQLETLTGNTELVATFNNIDELSRTFNLIDKSQYVRGALAAIFKNSSKVIFEPPLIHLKKISDSGYEYDIKTKHGQLLEFTQLIANGYDLDEAKKDDFRKYCEQRVEGLQNAAELWNSKAEEIKGKKIDKKKHRKENSIPLNRSLISLMVKSMTKAEGIPNGFSWDSIELFENTLKAFFNELELSSMKIQANDWFDLLQLLYVQPGSLLWTRDSKWKMIINKAGMGKYLFEK